jgi:hypothetical protein
MEEPHGDERHHLNEVKNRLEHAIIRVNVAKSDRDHCVDQSKKAAKTLAMAQYLQQNLERELYDLNTISSIRELLERLTLPEQLISNIISDIKQALSRHGEHTEQTRQQQQQASSRQSSAHSDTSCLRQKVALHAIDICVCVCGNCCLHVHVYVWNIYMFVCDFVMFSMSTRFFLFRISIERRRKRRMTEG